MKKIELKLLVGEDNLEEVFSKLREILTQNPDLFNQYVVTYGRYRDTRKYFSTSTAQKEEIDRELNKIRTSLLSLIDRLPESVLSDKNKKDVINKIEESIEKGAISSSDFNEAQSFFYTLDDSSHSESFPQLIKGANRIMILARTGVNLLSQYYRQFLTLGKSGCDIRLLIISPESDATKYVYGDNPEMFYENARKTDYYVKKLQDNIGSSFQIRTIKHAPTMGIMIFEKSKKEDCFIRCQLYFLHSLIGRDRPLFKIKHGDKWYRPFFNEFDELWQNGEMWDLKIDNQ